MTDKIYKSSMTYLNNYKQDILSRISNELLAEGMRSEEINDDLLDQYIDSEEMNETIKEDLSEENFNDFEINEVISKHMSDDTTYKFIIFAIKYFDDELYNTELYKKLNSSNIAKEDIESLLNDLL